MNQTENQHKRVFGLVGFPLGHSFSRSFFNEKFANEGIDACYVNFEIPAIDDLRPLVDGQKNLCGLNVTIPYKEKVLPYLDCIDDEAAKIGAVNVVKLIRDNSGVLVSLKGFNTDIIGFVESIRPLLKPMHTKALVLGTGGASKAVCQGLRILGIEPVLVSRKPIEGQLSYDELNENIISTHHVIVNTTPLGMYPKIDECPNIPYSCITPYHLCYDLHYNPEITLFLKKSAEQGAEIKNGMEMLILQALAAWDIWNS